MADATKPGVTRLDLISTTERETLTANLRLTNKHADGEIAVTPKSISELRASNKAAIKVYRLQKEREQAS